MYVSLRMYIFTISYKHRCSLTHRVDNLRNSANPFWPNNIHGIYKIA